MIEKKITNRISKIWNISEEFVNERPPFPGRAKIEITNRCNLRCFFCQHTYDQGRNLDINSQLLFRLLDELKALNVKEVGLFWMGEPLLNKKLPDYIAYAKQIGIPYDFITTNGVLANQETLSNLYNAGLDSIKFSINASSRKKYKEMCGVDAFDKVKSNIKTAYRLRNGRDTPSIYASSVFDSNDEEEYERIADFVAPYVDQHYPVHLYGRRKLKTEGVESSIVANAEKDEGPRDSMLPCWSLFTVPHISCDGNLSACFCDSDARLFMGDLNLLSFMDAWHSDKFSALRRHHLNRNVAGTVCQKCVAFNKLNNF